MTDLKRPLSWPEPVLTENAQAVLARRYLVKDTEGNVTETPADLFYRVARYIAAGDSKYGHSQEDVDVLTERFYTMLSSLDFLPNSPTLMNADRPLGQLSACFVLPVEDSLDSIFETLKDAALIHQSGGGTGFSFSNLRPTGDVVNSTMGVSSGPVSFMEVYNAATEAIKQGGTRRGANMGILRVDHPDIESFINAKNDLRKVTNFNISIAVTDDFMTAVQNKTSFDLIHPATGEAVKTVDAASIFNQIVQSAWQTGEPGMIFVDEINRKNPTPQLGLMESTNPCGEVPLLAYEACNLGSINLSNMVAQNSTDIDWDKLKETVMLSMRFLDNVITQNKYPIEKIKAVVDGNRKIGLGVMGWADCLLKLGVPYDSPESLVLAESVMSFIDYHSKLASVELAKNRGAFSNFDESIYANGTYLSELHQSDKSQRVSYADWQSLDEAIKTYGLRNATTTCIAPTGTISIIAGVSGGIEPVFAFVFTRNVMDNTKLPEVHPLFLIEANANGFNQSEILMQITEAGSLQGVDEIPDSVKHLFVTSFDISPDNHVAMQAVFQKYTDNAVSKTINFPESASVEDVKKTYLSAYELGVKGITVYRNNSRQDQPMLLEKKETHTDDQGVENHLPQSAVVCIDCD